MIRPFLIKHKTFISVVFLAAALFSVAHFINRADAQGVGIGAGIGGGAGGGGGAPAPVPLAPGDVYGWAWMGQDIENAGVSEGGGGWLNLNCKQNNCGAAGTGDDWGTKIRLVHDANYGLFTGHGWSSYYGWLSFEYDDVETCWQGNPFVVPQTPAKATLEDAGPWVPVVGWGKFVAGDVADDGWDGCVSFSGVNHGVEVNKTTGVLRGWAWGGPVTGWISFANPECPFCNTGIVLEGSTSIAFWADNTMPTNGATTLRWQATNTAPNYVAECLSYNNTSNYGHWQLPNLFGSSGNAGAINTGNGKLPSGSHAISGINQTTTYSLTCRDRYGVTLPTQYVTIFRNGLCTDPGANNVGGPLPCTYDPGICNDPLAENLGQPLPCTYDNNSNPATISLDIDQTIFYDNAANFNTALDWYSPDDLDSCVGSFMVGGISTNLAGWSGNRASPDVSGYTGHNAAFNTLLSNATSPQTYTFRITCQDEDNNPVTDTATVNLLPYVPSFEAPVVELEITDPNVQPPGLQREDVSPAPAVIPADITVRWNALNVNNCVATSSIYDITGTNAVSTNSSWNGSKSDEGAYTDTLDITNPAVRMPTKFFITCTADDPGFTAGNFGPTQIRREVCMGLSGASFPACSVTGTGNVPSYQEI